MHPEDWHMKSLQLPLVAACMLLFFAGTAHATKAGSVVFARGASGIERGSEILLMGNGTEIYEGDLLTIGQRSFAVIGFLDGTKMTLRPDTKFKVETFTQEAGNESALFNLFKGGMRAVTGLIAKSGDDAFTVDTPVAAIAIRGTDFSARLCDDACIAKAEQMQAAATPTASAVVGRVGLLQGELKATSLAGETRTMRLGASFYEGDILATGSESFAVLIFRDESRITLQATTRFQVERFRRDEETPDASSALLRLFNGGLRAVSGLIASDKELSYKIATPVATISTRGTRFDLVCQGKCVADSEQTAQIPSNLVSMAFERLLPAAHAVTPGGDGMFVVSREGQVVVALGNCAGGFSASGCTLHDIPPGDTVFLTSPQEPPQFGVDLPAGVSENLGPAPEDVEVPPGLFETAVIEGVEAGLFVAVYDEGHAQIGKPDGTTIDIGKGEAIFADTTRLLNLRGGAPPVITQDPYNFSPSTFTGTSLLSPSPSDPDYVDDGFQCRVQ